MRSSLGRADQITLVSFTIISVAAGLLLEKHLWSISLALPLVVVLLWTMALVPLNEAMVLAAHRRAIEDQMEQLLALLKPRVWVIGWERIGTRRTALAPIEVLQFVLFVLGGLLVAVISLVACWRNDAGLRWAVYWDIGLFAALLIACAYSASKIVSVYERAKSAVGLHARATAPTSWIADVDN